APGFRLTRDARVRNDSANDFTPPPGQRPNPPPPATPRPARPLQQAIDNQSQLVANHSHDRLRLPRPEYLESERRNCGGRALPCAGSPPPRHHDKLRKMLRNRL